jgi:hypothetical protein
MKAASLLVVVKLDDGVADQFMRGLNSQVRGTDTGDNSTVSAPVTIQIQ